MDTSTENAVDVERVEETFQRIVGDLSMIADRPLAVSEISEQRATTRPAGAGQIHISFKMAFVSDRRTLHGCLLVPLPDALTLAGYLMMISDEGVAEKRLEESLDSATKDALLEVGNFVASATDAALHALGMDHVKVRSEGCQGVRADVRPALVYEEGDELIVGRAKARLHDYPEFDVVLILPDLNP